MTVYRWALGWRLSQQDSLNDFRWEFCTNRSWHVLAKRLQSLRELNLYFYLSLSSLFILRRFVFSKSRRRWERQKKIYWNSLLHGWGNVIGETSTKRKFWSLGTIAEDIKWATSSNCIFCDLRPTLLRWQGAFISFNEAYHQLFSSFQNANRAWVEVWLWKFKFN